MDQTEFDWRYVTVVGFIASLVAVALMVGVLVVLAAAGNRTAAGAIDYTVVGVVIAVLITPLLSALVAFAISVFTAKGAATRYAVAAIVVSWLFDVALGVPAGVLAVVLTRPPAI